MTPPAMSSPGCVLTSSRSRTQYTTQGTATSTGMSQRTHLHLGASENVNQTARPIPTMSTTSPTDRVCQGPPQPHAVSHVRLVCSVMPESFPGR